MQCTKINGKNIGHKIRTELGGKKMKTKGKKILIIFITFLVLFNFLASSPIYATSDDSSWLDQAEVEKEVKIGSIIAFPIVGVARILLNRTKSNSYVSWRHSRNNFNCTRLNGWKRLKRYWTCITI